ncbi:thioredoxin-dependent thiol peroxidase [bacterium]|nr:thioredoxin-dependent thiol peroxidase [bacterium]
MSDYPEIGGNFPDFSLKNQNDEELSLSDFIGDTGVIIYFYPKDNTPGCTNEACDFRDREDFFKAEGWKIIGISPDDLKSHQKFSSKYELKFNILTDENNELSQKTGVWREKKNYGKTYFGISRTTFIVDKNGVIKHIFKNVKVNGHVDAILKKVKTI